MMTSVTADDHHMPLLAPSASAAYGSGDDNNARVSSRSSISDSGAGGGDDDGGDDDDELSYEPNKLGTINGVYVPCLLNIMGVIMFLRMSWAVGEAGWAGVMLMLCAAEVQSILTVLSVSAIASNGHMRGGGSYFIMSRSLGPQLGGAMGCLFYTAFSVSAAFYAIGFGTEVIGTWFPHHQNDKWALTLVSSIALAIVLGIAYIGAGAFTKINVWLFLLQFGATWVGLFSMWCGGPKELREVGGVPTRFEGMTGGVSRLRDNMWPHYTNQCNGEKCTTSKVFGIIFPAATGIMEGANLSGDLLNPAKSIGIGTLGAVFTSIIHYIMLLLTFGAGFDRASLSTNQLAWQDTTVEPYVLVMGVMVSSLSSALGAIFGGSRILQALGTDKILPGLSFFAKGTAKGNEPRRAVFFTWMIAQACVFIGDLDVVAPLISAIFCLSYGMVNLACFLLKVSGTPNFRPRFRYWSWHTALLGFIVSIGNMFFLDVWYAAVSLTCFLLLVIYLFSHAPESQWGDVRQALLFHQVRKYLLYIDPRKQRGKLWRPSILLLLPSLSVETRLIAFADLLKKGGLYVLGHVVVGQFDADTFTRTKGELIDMVEELKVKAFPDVAMAASYREAFNNLVSLCGLGGMIPNTVLLPLCAPDLSSIPQLPSALTYIRMMRDVTALQKELVLAANFHAFTDEIAYHDVKWSVMKRSVPTTVDVWLYSRTATHSWHEFGQTPLLLLQLAHVLSRNRRMSVDMAIRVMRVVDSQHAHPYILKSEEAFIGDLLEESRIVFGHVCAMPFGDSKHPTRVSTAEERILKSKKRMMTKKKNNDDGDDEMEEEKEEEDDDGGGGVDNDDGHGEDEEEEKDEEKDEQVDDVDDVVVVDDDVDVDDDDIEEMKLRMPTPLAGTTKRLSAFTISALHGADSSYRRVKETTSGLGVDVQTRADYELLNRLMRRHSSDAHVILCQLPPMHIGDNDGDNGGDNGGDDGDEASSVEYLTHLQVLTEGLPPVLFAKASLASFFTREI